MNEIWKVVMELMELSLSRRNESIICTGKRDEYCMMDATLTIRPHSQDHKSIIISRQLILYCFS